MTTQNNGSMTALEAGLEAVLFAAGDAVTIERLSAALEVAPAELLDAAAALENRYDFENRGIMLLRIEDKLQLASSRCTRSRMAADVASRADRASCRLRRLRC